MSVYFWNDCSTGKDRWGLGPWTGDPKVTTCPILWLTPKEEALLDDMPRELWGDWFLDNEARAVPVDTSKLLPF